MQVAFYEILGDTTLATYQVEGRNVDRPKSIRHSGAVAARSALRNQSYPLIPTR